MTTCPECGARGRAIEAATLEAQIQPARLSRIDDREGWRLCTSSDCAVVYFRGDATVRLGATRAVPFHKSASPERLVCFCFEHTVAEVEADARAHGTSTIQAAIAAACKAGRDDCTRKNPRGRCCLGHVGQVIAACGADTAVAESGGCCAPRGGEQASMDCSDQGPNSEDCRSR